MKGFIHHKKLLTFAFIWLLLLLPTTAKALVNVKMEADSNHVQAGSTVEVTVTVSGKSMAIVEGSFTYDPAVLAYDESQGGASDGLINMISAQKGGADTLTARIRFKAVGAGSAKIEVFIEKVLGYDGTEQEGAKANLSVSASAPDPTPAPTPQNYAAKGILAQNVKNASEEMYIWRTLENVTIPSRYSETTLTYHGETVAAAKVEDSDAPTLLYLSNAVGDTGGYYIYNAEADTLYPYQTISSVSKSYILLEPSGNVALPEGFTETILLIGEKEYPAWKAEDIQGEVYLLYARNPNGEAGYFVYNAEDESLQRYTGLPMQPAQAVQPSLPAETPFVPVAEKPEAPAAEKAGDITLSRAVLYALCGVGILLLIAVIGLLVLRHVEKMRRRRRAAQRRAEYEAAYNQELKQ